MLAGLYGNTAVKQSKRLQVTAGDWAGNVPLLSPHRLPTNTHSCTTFGTPKFSQGSSKHQSIASVLQLGEHTAEPSKPMQHECPRLETQTSGTRLAAKKFQKPQVHACVPYCSMCTCSVQKLQRHLLAFSWFQELLQYLERAGRGSGVSRWPSSALGGACCSPGATPSPLALAPRPCSRLCLISQQALLVLDQFRLVGFAQACRT